ncbi:hypothetical protein ACJOV8_014295 [Formosa sp. 3Alg 14/1]|uniref:hypothetical protein n=1 Tax=Formosa sp. 3Alg 14/1 TaxID=3382190 RepID=UPI0039BE3117
MKKVIILLLIILPMIACSEETDCCVNPDISLDITYLNADGLNLFEIEQGYSVADITVYHKINGEWEVYYKGNLDAPKGITVVDGTHGTYLSISPSTNLDQNKQSETKIQFSASDSDIIKAEIDQSHSNTSITKVWYNDVLVWENHDAKSMIEIIK